MAAENISDDFDYKTWVPATKSTLIEKGLWDVVEKGVPPHPSKDPDSAGTIQVRDLSEWRKLVRKDMDALEIMQSSLPDSVAKQTLSVSSSKELWDLLKKGTISRLEKQFDKVIMEQGLSDEYLMLLDTYGDFTYDEDLWMVCAKGTTNHMTPYEKNFTTLDRSHKSKVRLVDGSYMRVEGRGDMKIVMKVGKKKTIKNVLFVPELDRNVLSFKQLVARGYKMVTGPLSFYGPISSFQDRTGAALGDSLCDQRGLALRLQVVEGTQQPAGTDKKEEEIVVDYVMTVPMPESDPYKENLWMLTVYATMHMSPYQKVFTTLDRTHKGRVRLADGKVIVVEGKGDVKVLMKGGKRKTIANVLFVPGLNRNVLSFNHLAAQGCSMRDVRHFESCIVDETGAEFGGLLRLGEGVALELVVIGGNLTS